MTDPTGPTPEVAGAPGPPGLDRRVATIAVVAGVNVLLIVLLLVVRASDDDVASDDVSTTTTSPTTSSTTTSTTSTTSTTTTTAPPATGPATAAPPTTTTSTTRPPTTTDPPTTIAPSRCTGRTAPDDPDPVAELFYEAWTVADRRCAERIATSEAVDELFRFDGSDADWSFQGCAEDEDAAQPHSDCSFRYEGGAAVFELAFGALNGWHVRAVEFVVD